jgi:hypothetical protein
MSTTITHVNGSAKQFEVVQSAVSIGFRFAVDNVVVRRRPSVERSEYREHAMQHQQPANTASMSAAISFICDRSMFLSSLTSVYKSYDILRRNQDLRD